MKNIPQYLSPTLAAMLFSISLVVPPHVAADPPAVAYQDYVKTIQQEYCAKFYPDQSDSSGCLTQYATDSEAFNERWSQVCSRDADKYPWLKKYDEKCGRS